MLAKELKDILANVPDNFRITFTMAQEEDIVNDAYEVTCAYKYEKISENDDDSALVLVGG